MSDREEILKRLQENVTRIKEEIATCCLAANRDVSSVKLVAVTKYVDARIMRFLFEAGCTTMGENRGDSLRDKVDLLDDLPIEFHFIGHLQRNKIKWVLPSATLIHSVDSLRLMEALNSMHLRINANARFCWRSIFLARPIRMDCFGPKSPTW